MLHDIHPAPAPSWWPPAPGWWLLGLLFVALLVVAGWRLAVLWRHWRLRRRALDELQRLVRSYRDDPRALTAGLSILLRRAALARFPRREVAALAGEAWLRFLDRTGDTNGFSNGAGRALADAPFQRAARVESNALIGLTRRWLRRNL